MTVIKHTTARIIARPFRDDADFWRVRDLLIATYPLTPTQFNLDIGRWDGQRFHRADPALDARWAEHIQLWETEHGQLVGAVHPEDGGDAILQVHPDYRHIEDEMLAWAEAHLAVPTHDGQRRQLVVFAFDYDTPRRRLLATRGYEPTAQGAVSRRMRFAKQVLPQPALAAGYTLRTTRVDDAADAQRVADLLDAAFNRTCHTTQEIRTFTAHAPSFRRDLDLAAEASDGSFAAYVGVTYDQANQRGIFEAVCTHPLHQRRGLAHALMLEGLQRLKALGATDAYVDTGDAVPANSLYDAVGFTEAYRGCIWRKVF